MENLDLFLAELSMLSQKYGIVVAGCGCCGSPYLLPVDDLIVGHPDGHYEYETGKSYSSLAWVGPEGERDG